MIIIKTLRTSSFFPFPAFVSPISFPFPFFLPWSCLVAKVIRRREAPALKSSRICSKAFSFSLIGKHKSSSIIPVYYRLSFEFDCYLRVRFEFTIGLWWLLTLTERFFHTPVVYTGLTANGYGWEPSPTNVPCRIRSIHKLVTKTVLRNGATPQLQ